MSYLSCQPFLNAGSLSQPDIEDKDQCKKAYILLIYEVHLCRPLLEARPPEQRRQQLAKHPGGPVPSLLQPQCRLFVEGHRSKPEDHIFIQALKESGQLGKQIEVKEIVGLNEDGDNVILGWCSFTYQVSLICTQKSCSHSDPQARPFGAAVQCRGPSHSPGSAREGSRGAVRALLTAAQAKEIAALKELGFQQRSGLLEGYSSCLLSRDPGFPGLEAKGAQVPRTILQ